LFSACFSSLLAVEIWLSKKLSWLIFSYFCREERKSFIRAKYIDKAFIQPYYSSTRELYGELEQAIDSHNLADLLQCFAEGTHLGVELTDSLPNSVSFSYGNNYKRVSLQQLKIFLYD
jgi:hypothetical protein